MLPAGALDRVIFAGILSFFIATRVTDLHFTFWNDEVFSVTTARLGWRMCFERIANDIVHPPLFYIVLKGWMAIGGESLPWLRLLPVSISLVTILPFVALCRELRLSAKEVNLAFLLFAANWFLAWHAVDLRMYSFLLFFTTTSLWLCLKVVRGEWGHRALIALCVVDICLVYTHYYGWLVVAVEVGFAALTGARPFGRLALVFAAASLSFLPWVLVVFKAMRSAGGLERNLAFIERPDPRALLWLYVKLNGIFMSEWRTVRWTAVMGLLLFTYPILVWGRRVVVKTLRARTESDRSLFEFLLLGAFVPAATAFIVSHFLSVSVWADRYLVVVAVPYLLLVAVSASRLSPRWLRLTTVALIVLWAVAAGLQGMTRQRFSWGYVVTAMQNAEPSVAGRQRVIAVSAFAYMPVDYYLRETNDTRFEVEYVSSRNNEVERILTSEAAMGRDGFWVAYGDDGARPGKSVEEILREKGFRIGERFESGTTGNKVLLLHARR